MDHVVDPCAENETRVDPAAVTNFGEHLIRRVTEELFYELYAPPRLVAGGHLPGIGLADTLETASVPQKDGIRTVIAEVARHEP